MGSSLEVADNGVERCWSLNDLYDAVLQVDKNGHIYTEDDNNILSYVDKSNCYILDEEEQSYVFVNFVGFTNLKVKNRHGF